MAELKFSGNQAMVLGSVNSIAIAGTLAYMYRKDRETEDKLRQLVEELNKTKRELANVVAKTNGAFNALSERIEENNKSAETRTKKLRKTLREMAISVPEKSEEKEIKTKKKVKAKVYESSDEDLELSESDKSQSDDDEEEDMQKAIDRLLR